MVCGRERRPRDIFLTFASESLIDPPTSITCSVCASSSSKTSGSWRQVLASALRAEHYDVVLAPTGEDGFFRANAEPFDLVLLDLMLPGRSGLEILQTLRKRQVQTPVLILTARDGIDDRVLGLDLGADDYLVKPFALPELLARIRAVLRRGRPTEVLRLTGRRPRAGSRRASRHARRAGPRPHGARVRAARVPAAPSRTRRVAGNARPRRVEGTSSCHADRQRHRCPGGETAPEGGQRRTRSSDSHGSRCRIRAARGRAMKRPWAAATDSRASHRVVRGGADDHVDGLRGRNLHCRPATSSSSSSMSAFMTISKPRKGG